MVYCELAGRTSRGHFGHARVLALLLHVRARDATRVPVAAVVALAVALLSSEVALGTLAFVVSYEVFGRDDARAARVKAVLPYAVLAASYIVAYGAMGYGVTASGFHRSRRWPSPPSYP